MQKIITWWKRQKTQTKIISIIMLLVSFVLASWNNLFPYKIEVRNSNGNYWGYWKWFGFTFGGKENA